MLEFINTPDLTNKVLRDVKWEVKPGDYVEKNDLLCVLTVEVQEENLLALILKHKVLKFEKIKIYSKEVGTIWKVHTKEETLDSGIICEIKPEGQNVIKDCEHEIEYGGICVKCGELLEE